MANKLCIEDEDEIIKSMRYLVKLKKRDISDIRTLFEQEYDGHKPKRVGSFRNSNYIEYESNRHRNKNLSIKKHLNEIKPYLTDMIIYFQKSVRLKV